MTTCTDFAMARPAHRAGIGVYVLKEATEILRDARRPAAKSNPD
jgi:hypothetical protein